MHFFATGRLRVGFAGSDDAAVRSEGDAAGFASVSRNGRAAGKRIDAVVAERFVPAAIGVEAHYGGNLRRLRIGLDRVAAGGSGNQELTVRLNGNTVRGRQRMGADGRRAEQHDAIDAEARVEPVGRGNRRRHTQTEQGYPRNIAHHPHATSRRLAIANCAYARLAVRRSA